MIGRAVALIAALLAAARPARAGEEVRPALTPDPKVTAVLESLDSGCSALLPAARTTGDINDVARKYRLDATGPRGRDYCVRMLWMSDRKRAIFCGANHGVPHRLNDVWEYDLAANTWVCLYGPDDLGRDQRTNTWGEAWKTVALSDGVLRTSRGGPAVMGHEWCQATYDPSSGTMYFNSQWSFSYYPKDVQERYLKSGKHDHDPPLWSFRPADGKWQPVRTAKPAPGPGVGMNKYLEYAPELKGLLYADASSYAVGTWLYNPATNSWKELPPGGSGEKNADKNPVLPYRLGVTAYCSGKGLLAACTNDAEGRGRTVQYDAAANRWEQICEGAEIPIGHPAFTPCGYDPISGAVLLWEPEHRFQKIRKRTALWAYDVGARKWSEITPRGPLPPRGKLIGYFDPERNVFVVDVEGKPWVYRHRRKAK